MKITRHLVDGDRDWIGLRYGDTELTNCVDAADWHTQPAAPWACWHCGNAWCCQHRLARIVRTEDQLLWMAPYFSTFEYKAFADIRPEQLFDASLLIDRNDWETNRKVVPSLPPFDSFSLINTHDICHLWLQNRPSFAVPEEWDSLSHHLSRKCIASHPFDLPNAIEIIEKHLNALQCPAQDLVGRFEELKDDPDSYNTLYFDLEGTPEFIAFLALPSSVVISGRYYFSPVNDSADQPLQT